MWRTTFSVMGLALIASSPAIAQGYNGYGDPPPGYGSRNDGDDQGGYVRNRGRPDPWRIGAMVEQAIRRGEVNATEANYLRDQVRQLRRLDLGARRDGDAGWRGQAVARRTDDILNRLRQDRRQFRYLGAPGSQDDNGYPAQPAYRDPRDGPGYPDAGNGYPGYDNDQRYARPADSGDPNDDQRYDDGDPGDAYGDGTGYGDNRYPPF